MMTKFLWALVLCVALALPVSANQTTVDVGVENPNGYSMTGTFYWTIKKNGTTTTANTSGQNLTVSAGGRISIAQVGCLTNDTVSWTWNCYVYETNSGAITPSGNFWEAALGQFTTVAVSPVNGPNGGWESGVGGYNLDATMVPVGGSSGPCYTNVLVTYYDTWTNTVYVTARDSQSNNLGTKTYGSLVSGLSQDTWAGVPCGNLVPMPPYSNPLIITYSNVPVCMAPLVFNVQNTSSQWRIMAVSDTTGPGTLINQQFVGPTNWYYYSNSVPCSDVSHFHLYASGANGDDNVTDTGITAQGTGASGTNSSNSINPSQSPGTGNIAGSSGNAPPVANTPPPLAMTNNFLPTVPSPSTNQIVWSNTNIDLSALPSNTKDVGQALYNAVNTAANQAHQDAANAASQAHSDAGNSQTNAQGDANGIIDAINRFHADNNANLGQISGNINGAAGLAHSDAVKMLNALNGLGTNQSSQSLTNYALETSQQKVINTQVGTSNSVVGISNLIAGAFGGTNANDTLDTNFANLFATNSSISGAYVDAAGPTDYVSAQALSDQLSQQTGLATQENAFTSYINSFVDFSSGVPDVYPSVAMTYDFSVVSPGLGVMDFDPLHTSWGPELFAVAKKMFTWLIVLGYLVKCTEEGWKAIMVVMGSASINAQTVRTVIKNTGTSGLPGNPIV